MAKPYRRKAIGAARKKSALFHLFRVKFHTFAGQKVRYSALLEVQSALHRTFLDKKMHYFALLEERRKCEILCNVPSIPKSAKSVFFLDGTTML